MRLNKPFLVWISLVVVLSAWWWYYSTCDIICIIRQDIVYETWDAGVYKPVLFVVVAWAMWYCHENFGWFVGRSSDSESPRIHRHPKDDLQ